MNADKAKKPTLQMGMSCDTKRWLGIVSQSCKWSEMKLLEFDWRVFRPFSFPNIFARSLSKKKIVDGWSA